MILIGALIVGIGMLITDNRAAVLPVTKIRRNTYGEGEKTELFRIWIGGKEQEEALEVTVGERQYTEEELGQVFQDAAEKLEKEILGENDSFDHVDRDLNLVTEVEGEPIRVEWELSRYDVMNSFGQLKEEELAKNPSGVLVTMRACLTYTENEEKKYVREMTACVYPKEKSSEEAAFLMAKSAIEEEEKETRENASVLIPKSVNGKKIELRNFKNMRGWYVVLLGVVICILLVLLEKQNQKQDEKERERQMLLDYPEITDKLALLLGAGITVKNAWTRIVFDYERRKEEQGIRYAYEEMVVAYHEMQSGVTEAECYERFGRRCGIREYRKLATLLSQNLRKGTRGITELLKTEAEEAFEERKSAAKRKGEEAGTKLLVPMFAMLAMVLVIVIVPAFLSLQL